MHDNVVRLPSVWLTKYLNKFIGGNICLLVEILFNFKNKYFV